jgi:hypothetical protein
MAHGANEELSGGRVPITAKGMLHLLSCQWDTLGLNLLFSLTGLVRLTVFTIVSVSVVFGLHLSLSIPLGIMFLIFSIVSFDF